MNRTSSAPVHGSQAHIWVCRLLLKQHIQAFLRQLSVSRLQGESLLFRELIFLTESVDYLFLVWLVEEITARTWLVIALEESRQGVTMRRRTELGLDTVLHFEH